MKRSRKMTYAAACAALSTVCVIASTLTKLTFPLMIAMFCYYIALSKCGWGYGIFSMVASIAISFFSIGIGSGEPVLCAVFFVPYALLAFAFKEFKTGAKLVIRLAVVAVFAIVIYILLSTVLSEIIQLDFKQISGWLVYAVGAVFVIILTVFDFVFGRNADALLARIFKEKQ